MYLREKSTDFSSVFTIRFDNESLLVRKYELNPPHVSNVATLPCENQNSENVILQWDKSKKIASNMSYMLHRNGPVDCKICGVMQQCVYGTNICGHLRPI